MRLFSKVLLSAWLLAAGAALLAQDNETISANTVLTVNPLGDSTLTMTTTLTAKQFAAWKSMYGDDQGLLRRDTTKEYLGMMDITDWDVKIDSMNRVIAISLKVHGTVLPRGGGTFAFKVPKAWRGGERNGSTYSYNFANPMGNGGIEQDNVKLIFPANASNFVEDKSETGDTVVQYRVPEGGMTGMLLYAGAGLLVLGLLVIVLALAVIKPPRPVPA